MFSFRNQLRNLLTPRLLQTIFNFSTKCRERSFHLPSSAADMELILNGNWEHVADVQREKVFFLLLSFLVSCDKSKMVMDPFPDVLRFRIRTMCPRSSDLFYIVFLLYKTGQYFLDIQYLSCADLCTIHPRMRQSLQEICWNYLYTRSYKMLTIDT